MRNLYISPMFLPILGARNMPKILALERGNVKFFLAEKILVVVSSYHYDNTSCFNVVKDVYLFNIDDGSYKIVYHYTRNCRWYRKIIEGRLPPKYQKALKSAFERAMSSRLFARLLAVTKFIFSYFIRTHDIETPVY